MLSILINNSLGFVPGTNLAQEFPWILQKIVTYVLPWMPSATPLHVGK